MSDVQVYDEEPDQLPADGVWLADLRIEEQPVTFRAPPGSEGQWETADCDIAVWAARDGEPEGLVRRRCLDIRQAIRRVIRADENLAASGRDAYAIPTSTTLLTATRDGARMALCTLTVRIEIK